MTQTTEPAELFYLLWSNKHSAWWMPEGWGYTKALAEAGRYTEHEALRYVLASAQCGDITQVTSMVVDVPR